MWNYTESIDITAGFDMIHHTWGARKKNPKNKPPLKLKLVENEVILKYTTEDTSLPQKWKLFKTVGCVIGLFSQIDALATRHRG